MPAPQWLVDYYDDVDNQRLEPWLERHTPDAVVVFGNNPPAQGREVIGQNIGGFWSMIGGLRHDFVNVWEAGDTTVLEAAIDYWTKADEHVVVPCVSLLHRTGDLVDSLRIYIDLAPLFAKIGPPPAP